MSLYDLQKWAPSVEDFADAHEPVNDGVKEVPNAQTIAASVGKGDVGKDTTNSGEAKVIPEKEDTDDNTEKQFDTVSEAAEKGGSDSKPAPKAPATKPDDESTSSTDTGSETKTDAGSESDTQSEGKAPPFVKKEPLEHDSKEAAEDEKEKTEKVTKALEAYAPHAQRFDVIGYPKADRDRLQKSMNWLAKRTGLQTGMTVSAESIDAVVKAGRTRIDYLAQQVSKHVISNESLVDAPVVDDLNTAPTEHGNAPLPAEAAAAITDLEIGVPDEAFGGDTGIAEVTDAIQTLQEGQVAIEQYIGIIRSTKRISKQAAAVLQAGLEAIDAKCGLKVRATGLEGYDTSPKASMEDAEVNEKSLLDRAGEIGAKILKWLNTLIEKASNSWQRLSNGLTQLKLEAKTIRVRLDKEKGPNEGIEFTLPSPPTELFIGDEFVGDWVSNDELDALNGLQIGLEVLERKLVMPALAIVRKDGISEETVAALQQLGESVNNDQHVQNFELPGGFKVAQRGAKFEIEVGENEVNLSEGYTYQVPSRSKLVSQTDDIIKYIDNMGDGDVISTLRKIKDQVTKELTAVRKKGEFDEVVFQKVQTALLDTAVKPFSMDAYFSIVRHLARGIKLKLFFMDKVLGAKAPSAEE